MQFCLPKIVDISLGLLLELFETVNIVIYFFIKSYIEVP